MNVIPSIMNGNTFSDIFSAMLKDRVIYLEGEINSQMAAVIKAQLQYLDSCGEGDIEMHIDSPGGSVSAGMSIIDVMNHTKCDVVTVCSGIAASMGAVIFSSGTPGKRYMLKHSEVLIHQPSGAFEGKESDIRIMADHISRKKRELIDVLAANCKQPTEKIEKDIEADYYMDAAESVAYGIADKILDA